jgi:uncharacterized protein YcbK (DUF882 family)
MRYSETMRRAAWASALPLVGVCLGASIALLSVASPVAGDGRVPHASGLASKKAPLDPMLPAEDRPPLLATLVQIHSDEVVPLDASSPSEARFDALLADRTTGEDRPLDPHLLALLRALAGKYPAARVELVSGYRSWKLNEVLRKKGHHVASHSQHSLGRALDFRLFPAGAPDALDPRALEQDIRALGWDGGVGVYTTKDDWFVHADVGPSRGWSG